MGCWPLPKQGNAWSHRDLFHAGNHFKGKEENLKHTITCQCTTCNNYFQQAQSLDVREQSTARNKFAPQSQQNRLHLRKRTARNKLVPRGQQNRLHQNEDRNQIGASGSSKSAPSKKAHCKNKIGTSRSTKSTSSKRGQKLVPLGQQNRPN